MIDTFLSVFLLIETTYLMHWVLCSGVFFPLILVDVVYCPRRVCGSAVIFESSGAAAQCSVCSFAFCVTCRKNYHGTEGCPKKRITEIQEAEADLPQSQGSSICLFPPLHLQK